MVFSCNHFFARKIDGGGSAGQGGGKISCKNVIQVHEGELQLLTGMRVFPPDNLQRAFEDRRNEVIRSRRERLETVGEEEKLSPWAWTKPKTEISKDYCPSAEKQKEEGGKTENPFRALFEVNFGFPPPAGSFLRSRVTDLLQQVVLAKGTTTNINFLCKGFLLEIRLSVLAPRLPPSFPPPSLLPPSLPPPLPLLFFHLHKKLIFVLAFATRWSSWESESPTGSAISSFNAAIAANDAYLLHGAQPENVQLMLTNGIKPAKATAVPKAFGIYTTDDIRVADQYAIVPVDDGDAAESAHRDRNGG